MEVMAKIFNSMVTNYRLKKGLPPPVPELPIPLCHICSEALERHQRGEEDTRLTHPDHLFNTERTNYPR